MRAASCCGIVFAACFLVAKADVPSITGVFPAGGQRGTEFKVSVSGKLEPWPLQAICDDSRITFSPDEKDKGTCRVQIGADVEPGAYLVRFHNAEGAAPARQFVVGSLAERTQSGFEITTIPAIDLPLTLNGKFKSGGAVDRYALELKADQVLVAEVTAYAIGSPVDPLLQVRGPRGERLAFNHDATRDGLDPRLVFKAPAAGIYELHLAAFAYPPQANIKFTGGATAIYRMTLGHDMPRIELPPPHESEGETAQLIAIPATIGGRINPAGDTDRYQFDAKKGDTLRVEVAAAEFRSWMDPVLVIEDSAGKELARHDDIDSKARHDAVVDWTAPSDGSFVAVVLDLNGVGGSEIVYQFRLSKPEPSIAATATGAVYTVRAGEKLEIPVKVARRYGHKGEWELGVDGLSEGVSATPVTVPEKGGDLKLTLEASADAAPASGPITIWVGPKGATEGRVRCRFELKGAFADAGDLLINETEKAWLTVLPKK